MRVAEAPDIQSMLASLDNERFIKIFSWSEKVGLAPGYPHWDKLRHLKPPDDLDHREWWLATKLARRSLLRPLPLTSPDGKHFSYAIPDDVFRLLHYVDQHCSGEIAMTEVVPDSQARQHYMVNSLMEEAIRSSQLEGATTSRRVAKELLRSGREPQDRSERMIINNYRALQFMREIGDQITAEDVLALQGILTEGTLDNPDAAGRLQRADEDRVAVFDRQTGDLIHSPPPAEQLPERLQALCDFANHRQGEGERFLHPVVRGVILHFWLAYDHPFEDGNGRTARALFYWYMRTRGYWLVGYLTISNILRKAPTKYTKSFLLTETDERDTTYFLLYQLEVIERAVEELHRYLRKKMAEVRSVEELIKGSTHFNHRQLALLSDAVRDHGHTYTLNSHATSHNVTHETARNDLSDLMSRGLLERRRNGRQYLFSSPLDIVDRLKALD